MGPRMAVTLSVALTCVVADPSNCRGTNDGHCGHGSRYIGRRHSRRDGRGVEPRAHRKGPQRCVRGRD
jgi:hypothetical protein